MKSSILPEHKELLLSQSESKTLPEWVVFFNNIYSAKKIYDFCYYHKKKIKKISKEELSRIQSIKSRKYSINEDYFKKETSNKYYILGLWFADGCIYRKTHFDLTLHKKDKYLLKKIANEMNYEGKVYDYPNRNASRLNFSCKEIYEDLIRLGGTERKSLNTVFPNIPNEFLHDFIRGYFDGDGCIMRLKGGRVNSAFTSGSKIFLIELLKKLRHNAHVVGGYFDDSCCSLKFGKKDSLKIGEYMYKDNPELFLDRKREKFNIGG